MISKGCITTTCDQPEVVKRCTCDHAVEEGEERLCKAHLISLR